MYLRSLSFVVRSHGIVAMVFSLIFLLEVLGINLPLVSLPSQHPNFVMTEYTTAALLFALVAIMTFASYELFFLPTYLQEQESQNDKSTSYKRIKTIFVLYHLPWCFIVTYLALLPETTPSAYVSIGIMYGFTFWGILSK